MKAPLYALLAVVAAAAAVLSFSALESLARLCGFSAYLAWLLPVVVDAGAAAGSLVWLGGAAPEPARRFARGLALVLLGSSVAANALGHGLAAYALAPAWWVVVVVSAVAPAVLGAVVHLAVLFARPEPDAPAAEPAAPRTVADLVGLDDETEDDEQPTDYWSTAPPAAPPRVLERAPRPTPAPADSVRAAAEWAVEERRAGRPCGRQRIQDECGLSKYRSERAAALATQLLADDEPASVA